MCVPRDVEGLAGASADDLRVVEVEGAGLRIHFPRLDADLHVPALLEGVLGSRCWMAARLGAAGGQACSAAKAAAARDAQSRVVSDVGWISVEPWVAAEQKVRLAVFWVEVVRA